jgi:hypothetical protein
MLLQRMFVSRIAKEKNHKLERSGPVPNFYSRFLLRLFLGDQIHNPDIALVEADSKIESLTIGG